ncbi:MAG TPA: carboxymuconolactone decarboxylase family protein [Actinomycetales bacterium]|nr:carboxymuconolactone decarboxylase family protein [Actinomycetales bacterium]
MPSPIIREKPNLNPVMRAGIALAERITGRRMVPARLLAWYPKVAISSGVMESLVAHKDRQISDRELRFVRLAASFATQCPFCIDMNGHEFESAGITAEEVTALRNGTAADLPHLTPRERTAIEYAVAASSTPLRFETDLLERVTDLFSEREVVILATTAAQVNYWARLIQALQIPPAGFTYGDLPLELSAMGADPFRVSP